MVPDGIQRWSRRLGTAAAALLLACGPAQQVVEHGPLRLALPEGWSVLEAAEDRVLLGTGRAGGAQLSIRARRVEWEGPTLSKIALKSMLGTALNFEFGQVTSRMTFSGHALLAYDDVRVTASGEEVYSRNWVLAAPHSVGLIVRVDLSLQIPVEQRSHEELPALIDALDVRIADAELRLGNA